MSPSSKSRLKKILIALAILFVIGAGTVWYLFTKKFEDTSDTKSAYTVSAASLINEFTTNDSAANKKYSEQIVTVTGRVSEIEAADTTVNVKMIDTTTGSYAIFAFQSNAMAKAKQLKEGDSISIKGSCSGGGYSDILETHFINFKRCIVN